MISVRRNNSLKSSSIGMHIVTDNRRNSTEGTRVIIVIYSSPNFGSLFSRKAETPSAKSEVSEELVMSNFLKFKLSFHESGGRSIDQLLCRATTRYSPTPPTFRYILIALSRRLPMTRLTHQLPHNASACFATPCFIVEKETFRSLDYLQAVGSNQVVPPSGDRSQRERRPQLT